MARLLSGVLALTLLAPGLATGAAAYEIADAPAGVVRSGAAQTGLATVPLTLHTATGKHRYTVEVAQTPQAYRRDEQCSSDQKADPELGTGEEFAGIGDEV